MSVQTKEVPTALGALIKAKGQNVNKDIAIVQRPVAVMQETSTEVAATSAQNPELNVPATPEPQNPEPTEPRNDGRESPAWKELKQHHDMTVHQLRTQVQELETRLTKANRPVVKPPKTPEEMKVFKEQYGDSIDYMRTIVLEELANDGTISELQGKIENVNKLQKELVEKESFKKLLEEHPDAAEIRQSSEFAKWYNEQPDDIKAILSTSTDIRAISKQLTLYKLETGILTTKQKKQADAQKREEASMGVNITAKPEITAQKKIWTGSEIQKICSNHNEWKKHAAEIDLARKEGRVDMSK